MGQLRTEAFLSTMLGPKEGKKKKNGPRKKKNGIQKSRTDNTSIGVSMSSTFKVHCTQNKVEKDERNVIGRYWK